MLIQQDKPRSMEDKVNQLSGKLVTIAINRFIRRWRVYNEAEKTTG